MVVTEYGSGGVKRLRDNATDDVSQSEAKVLAVEEDGEESVSGVSSTNEGDISGDEENNEKSED